MKRFSALISAALLAALTGCAAPANNADGTGTSAAGESGVEEFAGEKPPEYYECELERVIPTEYEVAENDEGCPKIIFRYARQTRRLKTAD